MKDITPRQEQLLNSIIKEFIETADAVGSISLLNRYDFKLSSATIRNEMAELVFRGYLYKKHSSAGRIPTTKAWRFFVDKVEKGEISYVDASIREDVMETLTKVSTERSNLIREGLNFLAMLSENAVVGLVNNSIYYSGLTNLPSIPEFKESDNLQRILKVLEDYYTLSEVFNKSTSAVNDINILIGEEETGSKLFKNYSVIFSEIRFKNGERGFLAVVGPNRMNYEKIISALRYISDTIRHIVH